MSINELIRTAVRNEEALEKALEQKAFLKEVWIKKLVKRG